MGAFNTVFFEDKKLTGRRKFCHATIWLFMFSNDIADWISDWLFFTDVAIAEKGLVYGPPQSMVKWLLLVFSIFGTITFIGECVNLWWEVFRSDPWLDPDHFSAVVVWFEDLPQVVISLYLALCREEPISVFQLSKAAVVLIGDVLRFALTLAVYCRNKALKERHHFKTKIAIILGITIEAICAATIFFVTQTERDSSGNISFKVPTTVIQDTFHDQRYFANVSVFIHHTDLFNVQTPVNNKSDATVNWLRLVSLNNIRSSNDGDVSIRIDYEDSNKGTLKLAVLEKHGNASTNLATGWTWKECYTIDKTSNLIKLDKITTCSQPGYFSNSSKLFITFRYQKPGAIFKRQVFGDLLFNIKQLTNGLCQSVSVSNSAFDIPITFHYFRTNATWQPERIGHLHDPFGTPRFFRNKIPDLQDVTDVWHTGWVGCKSSGNISPTLHAGLQIHCD